jgi:hypothetical protein
MLEFVESTMGPGSTKYAEQWLASTVAAYGQQAVSQAYAILTEKRAAGEISARPLPHWSKIAAGLKARIRESPEASKPGGVWEALQRRKLLQEVAA